MLAPQSECVTSSASVYHDVSFSGFLLPTRNTHNGNHFKEEVYGEKRCFQTLQQIQDAHLLRLHLTADYFR